MQKMSGKEMWSAFKARMRQDKKFEGAIYILLLLLIALLYLSLRGPAKEKADAPAEASGVESRLADALSSMRGVGEVRVMVTYREGEAQAEEIQGVIVIAQGAQDVAVRLRIHSAVQTVLGVEAQRVEVFEMYEKEEGGE